MVFQSYALYPHMSVRKNIAFPLKMAQMDQAEIDRRVNGAAEVLNLTDYLDRRPGQLSGGQRQRVWIAMALAQDTPILLLDEPTTYLDIVHQVDLLELLSKLNAEGRTVVAVLHELNLAFRYAHHIVAMRDGRIVATGAPAEIVSEQLMREVFDLSALVIPDPLTGSPMVIPRGQPRP